MFTSETSLRVRYAETDQMGYVYHGNYAQYFEVARVEALRTLGLSYAEVELNGVALPVMEHAHKFLKPAHYDEELTIKTTVPEMPVARFKFEYEIRNTAGEVMTTGTTTLFFLNKETGRPMKAPKQVQDALKNYF
jgi:acyl-CoA thioester hydrolase